MLRISMKIWGTVRWRVASIRQVRSSFDSVTSTASKSIPLRSSRLPAMR